MQRLGLPGAPPAWKAEERRGGPGGKGRVGTSHREGGPAILFVPRNGTKKQKSNGTRVPTGKNPHGESARVDETMWTLAPRKKPQDWSRGKRDT